MAWTMRWRTTSRASRSTKATPSMSWRMLRTWSSPERPRPSGRSICEVSPVTTTLDPKPIRVRNIFICSARRVLRLVEDDERVVQRAAPHVGERRHLDGALLEEPPRRLRPDHVVHGVVERAEVGVDLGEQVAGQEAQALAGLDRRARQDDPVELLVLQGLHGERHREVRLAGTGRARPEGHDVAADRLDVAALPGRLRVHVLAAPHDGLAHARRSGARRPSPS